MKFPPIVINATIHPIDESLHRKVDKIMADITALQNAVDALEGVEITVVAEIKDLTEQIKGLEVGNITQDQVDSLTEKAASVVEAINQATTQAQQEAPDSPPAPTPGPEGELPEKTVYTAVEGADLTGIDTSQYTESGFETVPAEGETAEPLFYFSGDTPGEPPLGENNAYVVYEAEQGNVQKVA